MTIDKIGTFQVVGTLGSGAQSTILHIRRSADSKSYALKVVPLGRREDEKYLEQARHEFRIAQMLDHSNLIKIYALETQRDWLFRIRKAQLLIEYVNGRTLDARKHFPVAALAQIFVHVASGLTHMHRRHVLHADLKPNNILLSRSGEVKIIDYGLGWIQGENKGRVQGTPEYMAPEQALKKSVTQWSDIYNFGATMYRLLTGQLPPNPLIVAQGGLALDGKTWDRLIKPAHELRRDAPAELCDLIHRCLAFEPKQRPSRISEVQGALDHLADVLVQAPADRLDALEW